MVDIQGHQRGGFFVVPTKAVMEHKAFAKQPLFHYASLLSISNEVVVAQPVLLLLPSILTIESDKW